MIRVLVVDDSALMRRHLTNVLAAQPDLEVLSVRNGLEALEAIARFDPHVVTLDVNMPEMDGITCLSNIMVERPRPVVMVSSITEEGAEVTLQALSLGAVDVVLKPGGTISLSIERIEADLIAKVRAAASARVRRAVERRNGPISPLRSKSAPSRPAAGAPIIAARPVRAEAEPAARPRSPAGRSLVHRGIVLVGVSTGGPGALEELLPRLSADFPWPVLVAQHMPGAFTASFARRLDAMCPMRVVEVARPMPIEPGVIHIAKGDADLLVTRGALGPVAMPAPASASHLWHPSVARLVSSTLDVVPARSLIGVMLTGMGDDGAAEMTELRRRGGRTIAQDEATSVVFGMPGDLVRRGGAEIILPIERIAGQLSAWTIAYQTSSDREPRHGAR